MDETIASTQASTSCSKKRVNFGELLAKNGATLLAQPRLKKPLNLEPKRSKMAVKVAEVISCMISFTQEPQILADVKLNSS